MAYMDLIRGIRDGERIEYPIFEMDLLPVFTVGLVQAGSWSAFLSVIYTDNADISAAFPDGIPTNVESDGVVCQNDYKYVPESPAWNLKTQAFSGLAPTSTPPEDWSTNFFDYYTATTRTINGNTFAVFKNAASDDLTYHNSPPTWNPNTSYYHDDLPLQQRAAHIFTTDAGWCFGVNISPNWEYGYVRAVANCNPEHALVGVDDVFCVHDSTGNYYDGYIPSDTLAPYQLQMGFTNSIPFLQIFVHCIYNDIDYYGVAQILMSGSSATAHPIGIRMLAFPTECYGDSIKTGDAPQGGTWGNDSERGGGDGTFSAPSDNRGDSSGAYLTNYETSMRNALNDGFNNGGVKIYQIAGQYAGDVIGVLFGADYFDKFLNSMYNPLSAILSYHMIPSSLRGDAFANNIPLTAGGFNISAKMTTPTNFPQINSVKKLHVGSIDIANYFGAYPDFAPHTQAILHLPYIGDITIDINAIMYGTLSVDYFCDNVSGNVAAWIWCSDRDGKCTYKYIVTGNCAYTIPLYSQSQNGGAVGKIMSSGVSLVGGLLSGNAASAVGGALGVAGGLFDAATTPRNTQTTGGNSGNVSMLGDSVVWLEIIRPQWVNPENYQSQSGIPSQISGKISDFRGGFFQVETVDLENVPATDSEIAELEQMLKDGIYYLNE